MKPSEPSSSSIWPEPGHAPPGAAPASTHSPQERIRRLEARVQRERQARQEAERLLEAKSLELYESNQALSHLADSLEARVTERTQELSQARQAALMQAETDALTGIANRAAFTRHLAEVLRAAPEAGSGSASDFGPAVLLIDLDHFKTINDTLGHGAGDGLLVQVAQRMTEALRPGDFVARLGGDEFAVVIAACDAAQAQRVGERLLAAVSRPVVLGERQVPCSCSIGVALWHPGLHAQPDALLGDADLALYESKHRGRDRVTVFHIEHRQALERRADLELRLMGALDRGEFQPWFQPVVDRATGRLLGVEMLARWHTPEGRVAPPADFLGALEELDRINPLMEHLLRLALPEALPLVRSGWLGYVSVNVTPQQFDQGWAHRVLPALLAELGYPPHALVVELTETALLQDTDAAGASLRLLAASGLRVALDDFGVGYSNFARLTRLPFDLLKIDRSLTQPLLHDARDLAVIDCVLTLARRIGVGVIAEGVETIEQARTLAQAGCTAHQGYLYARPQRDLAALLQPGALAGFGAAGVAQAGGCPDGSSAGSPPGDLGRSGDGPDLLRAGAS